MLIVSPSTLAGTLAGSGGRTHAGCTQSNRQRHAARHFEHAVALAPFPLASSPTVLRCTKTLHIYVFTCCTLTILTQVISMLLASAREAALLNASSRRGKHHGIAPPRLYVVRARSAACTISVHPAAACARRICAGPNDDLIALLEQQAQQQPVVQLVAHQNNCGIAWGPSRSVDAQAGAAAVAADDSTWARNSAGAGALLSPTKMPFEAMYRDLASFKARFGACHVPRHCFDAPALGSWVRWLRKQRAEGQLPQWQADRWVGAARASAD